MQETLVQVAGPFHWGRTLARPRQQDTRDVRVSQDGGPARWESVMAIATGGVAAVTVEGLPTGIRVWSTQADPKRHDAAVGRVAWRFSVEADGEAFYSRAQQDPCIGPLAARWWGIRPVRDASPWVALARLILGQQVSVASHRTLVNRLLAQWGRPTITARGTRVAAWPAPEVLASENVDGLVAGGIPRRPATTLQLAARWAAEGGFLGPPDDVAHRLEALPGVGPWTTAGVRLFGWGDDDAVMASDLVLRNAAAVLTHAGRPFTARELVRWLEPYRPYRAWVCYLLWHERIAAVREPTRKADG